LKVVGALRREDLEEARVYTGRMVSRDTDLLGVEGLSSASTESVLENGADAIFASLFWYLVAGIPGVILHRLVNTLDAMWGYRTPQFKRFGWAAARLDDLLGWLPARLTAFSYGLVGNFPQALSCWRRQAPAWSSPNAGPVMAAGAGALSVKLGGAAPYHGEWVERPVLGQGEAANRETPMRAMALIDRAVFLWLLVILCSGAVIMIWF